MMIDEGEVKAPALHGTGFVFNKEGFSSSSPAPESVTTVSFVSVWAISMRDMNELGRTSAKIKEVIGETSRE